LPVARRLPRRARHVTVPHRADLIVAAGRSARAAVRVVRRRIHTARATHHPRCRARIARVHRVRVHAGVATVGVRDLRRAGHQECCGSDCCEPRAKGFHRCFSSRGRTGRCCE
jgi:hypothetical protein